MRIEPGSRVVFTGDSITDCGRGRPVGDNIHDTLGSGYVAFIDALVAVEYPDRDLRIFNTGVSGDTVRDLAYRWEQDVVALKPDWLSVMIGINDVWRQFDTDPALLRPVLEPEYRDTLRRLLNGIRPSVRGIVVMLPFYLEAGPGDGMRAMRDRYAKLALEVARGVGAVVVDTQAAMEALLRWRGRDRLAPDGVHPTLVGHMVLASAWLRAVNGIGS